VSGPRETYIERERRHAEARDRAHRASLRMSTLRMVTFLGLVAALVLWDVLGPPGERVAAGVAWLLAVLFVVMVARHRRIRATERRLEVLRGLAAEGLLRLDRRWDELEASLPEVEARHGDASAEHAYAVDLDVFGTASLIRLSGPVTSAPGRRTLRRWLLEAASPEEVTARQEAVLELTPAVGFREELAARGRLAPASEEDALSSFLGWAESEPWLLTRRWTLLASRTLPVLTLVLAVFELPRRGILSWWLVSLALQIWVLARVRRRVVESFPLVEEGAPCVQAAGPQLRLVEGAGWSSARLRELGERLVTDGAPAHTALARLVRLADVTQSRRGMLYVALAPVLLLDLHLGFALDRWRARWGLDVRRWLDALGHLEALSSLATLGHDHPDWSRPEWKVGESVLRAAGLGHPLLVPATCVRNDLEVGPPGTFLFITGSNMSGKSTLLRAVGANVVLAGAGAPVCATSLTLPPVRLWTSMRVDDSLADGVSRFMAELLRVRAVVEAARDAAGGEAPVLYLLDEMLQGTNTAERRVAARAVLRHLLEEGAIGGITSHDLTLADAPDLEPLRRAYHFREQVGRDGKGTVLTFDYVLRPGVATTRNALRLLEAVGLGHADAPAAEDVDEGPGSGGGT
jgi:hypothetical protein